MTTPTELGPHNIGQEAHHVSFSHFFAVCCRAIDNTKAAHTELDNKAQVADAALANSQSDIEKLQVEFNEASGLVQQKEQELREAKEAAEQKAKQLDVARY